MDFFSMLYINYVINLAFVPQLVLKVTVLLKVMAPLTNNITIVTCKKNPFSHNEEGVLHHIQIIAKLVKDLLL